MADTMIHRLVIVLVSIFLIGVLGFRFLFDESWVDSFFYAATCTSTIGLIPQDKIKDNPQKIFISVYVLVASCIFLVLAGYIVTSTFA